MKHIIVYNPSKETLDFLKEEAVRHNSNVYKVLRKPGVRIQDLQDNYMRIEIVETKEVEIDFPST